jgi:hypothetical protein
MPGKPFVYDLNDLTGGLSEKAPDTIADREMSVLEDFYIEGASLWSRPGRVALASAYSERINAITRYNPSFTSDEYTLCGCASSIARLVAGALVAIVPSNAVYPSLTARWWFRQYNDELFACQKGNGGVKRIWGDSLIEAGIPAPATPPQVADGGPGQKPAGTYWVGVTFYNTTTGAESNLSPLSKELAIPNLRRLALSAIPVSTSLQVNARRIYCSLKDDAGTLYLVNQIEDNVTATFTENALPPDDYGAAFEPVNGVPPDQAYAIEIANERLFITNKTGLYWSEAGKPQSFKAASYFPIAQGTGYELVGVKQWEDHGLVVGAQNKTHMLRGTTPSDWEMIELSAEHGSPAGQSYVVGDGVLYWYTGTNFVRSEGTSAQIIPASDRVRQTLDSIPDTSKTDVQGEVLPSRGWVCWTAYTPTGQKLIVYDYKADAWEVFTAAPDTIKRFIKSDQSEILLAAWDSDDILREYLVGTTDDGAAITATLQTKALDYGLPGMMHLVTHVSVQCPQTAGTVTVSVMNDMDGTLLSPRTVSLNRGGPKRIHLPTAGAPGFHNQIRIVYVGAAQLRIDRLQIEGVHLQRRVSNIL